MKLVGRVPVEPLDDERLTNIERRIVAGAADAAARRAPRGSRLPVAVAAMAAVVVLVAGAGFVGWRLGGGAPGAAPAPAEPAALAIRGDGERQTIDIGDARIASDPRASYVVTRPGGGVLVALARGKVELEVGKRGDRPPLVVRAGDTDVIVVGTRFSVDAGDGTGEVVVRVTEGVVEVRRQRQEVRVAAGEAWQTSRGRVALAALDAAAAPGDDERDDELIEVLHDRVATAPEAGGPTSPGRRHGDPARGATPGRSRHRTLDRPGDPYLDLKTRIRGQTVLPAADVGIADPRAAIAAHQQASLTAKGAAASRALYSVAYLQYLKLGRRDDALRTLELYRRRFQDGPEYSAALWLRVRILCLRAIDETCRQAAYTYLRDARDPDARAVAEAITLSRR